MTSSSDTRGENNCSVEHGVSNALEMYHLEDVRLATFRNIPPNLLGNPNYRKLARAGFYYKNRLVRCFCCGACISNSHSQPVDDDPVNLHQLLNPNCEFVQTLLRSFDSLINFSVTISTHVLNEDHLAHRTEDTEVEERTSLRDINIGGGESGYQSTCRSQEFSELQAGACSTRSNPTRLLDYRNFRRRLESFHNWPKSQSSRELAEAGFYYTGVGDRVRCFCCNYTFLEWKPHKRPWEEHSKGSPDCGFVKQNAPIEYQQPPQRVLSCQDSHQPSHDQPVTTAARIASLEKKVGEQEKRLEDQNNHIKELINVNQHLRNDIERLNEGIQCIICVSNARNILFCPCGHAACCKECYRRLKEGSNNQPMCPTCRQRIVHAYQMFWP